jgi:hypothetical protein
MLWTIYNFDCKEGSTVYRGPRLMNLHISFVDISLLMHASCSIERAW